MSRPSPAPTKAPIPVASSDPSLPSADTLPSSRVLRARAADLRRRADSGETTEGLDAASMEPLTIAMRRYAAELELLAAVLDAPPFSMVDEWARRDLVAQLA
jgi:hypothetical protein